MYHGHFRSSKYFIGSLNMKLKFELPHWKLKLPLTAKSAEGRGVRNIPNFQITYYRLRHAGAVTMSSDRGDWEYQLVLRS